MPSLAPVRYIFKDVITDDGSGGWGRCASCDKLLPFGTKVLLLSDSKTSHMGYENNRPHCDMHCIRARAEKEEWQVWIPDTMPA